MIEETVDRHTRMMKESTEFLDPYKDSSELDPRTEWNQTSQEGTPLRSDPTSTGSRINQAYAQNRVTANLKKVINLPTNYDLATNWLSFIKCNYQIVNQSDALGPQGWADN